MSALQAEIRTEHDLRARVNGLDEQLKAECQTRAQVEAERDCLREEIGAHDQELERERVAAAALQADLSALQGQVTVLKDQLQAERDARVRLAGVEKPLHAERKTRARGARRRRAGQQ